MARTYRPSNNGGNQQNDGVVSSTYIRGSVPNGVVSSVVNGVPQDVRRQFQIPTPVSSVQIRNGVVPPTPVSSTFIRGNTSDPYGRPTSGVGFGRGDGSTAPSRRPVANAGTYAMSNPGFTGPIADPLGRDPNGGGFGQGLTDEQIAWENQSAVDRDFNALLAGLGLNPDGTPINGGGGGGGGGGGYANNFDYGAAIQGLMQSGIFDPVAVPELQQYAAPTMQTAQQLPEFQQWNPELIDVASLQQWNPEMLAAPDFSGQYDNIAALYDQTTGQIADAYAPAIQALSAPLTTSVGSVAGTAQGLSPELQAFADSQGVGSDYGAQLAAENQGIQSNADLFTGRNQMLDRVFGNNRLNNLNIANQSQAGALSNAAVQQMLATAGLDQIAQNAAIQNAQYNNGLLNQAGQYNSGLVNNALLDNNALQNQAGQFNASGANDWALQQAGLNSAVDATNTNALNNWLMANTDIANQQSMLGYEGAAGSQANRLQAVLELIAQAAANGVAFDPSVLQGMVA